jgi:predicted transcriptional regulator
MFSVFICEEVLFFMCQSEVLGFLKRRRCFLNNKEIGRGVGLSIGSVSTNVRKLVKFGLVEVKMIRIPVRAGSKAGFVLMSVPHYRYKKFVKVLL